MQRKIFLVTLVIATIVALALLYFLLQPKAPSRPTIQPAVNTIQPQQAQNASQPKTKPPTIIATIEASQGGRVLANGTETAAWNSSRPFTLLLKAAPDTCYAFDHWEVNGTEHGGPDLALAITGNTTITAVFYKPLYTVKINANLTGIATQINGENHTLPASISVPACSTVEVKPLETPLYKPLNNTLKITVSSDTNIMLYYRRKSINSVLILINGKPQEVEVRQSPFIKNNGTIETTSDGWIHLQGKVIFIYVYIPWNLTNVTIEGNLISGNITIWRYCDWGAKPFAYGDGITKSSKTLKFIGCQPDRPPTFIVSGGFRYDYQLPGALVIDLEDGEVWLKIEAYP